MAEEHKGVISSPHRALKGPQDSARELDHGACGKCRRWEWGDHVNRLPIRNAKRAVLPSRSKFMQCEAPEVEVRQGKPAGETRPDTARRASCTHDVACNRVATPQRLEQQGPRARGRVQPL
jgi:hypothetical protein